MENQGRAERPLRWAAGEIFLEQSEPDGVEFGAPGMSGAIGRQGSRSVPCRSRPTPG